MSTELDPRWDWIDVGTAENSNRWIKGMCNHLTPAPVYAEPTGDLVAHLCPDCDAQLPAEWRASASVHESGARPMPLSRLLYP